MVGVILVYVKDATKMIKSQNHYIFLQIPCFTQELQKLLTTNYKFKILVMLYIVRQVKYVAEPLPELS